MPKVFLDTIVAPENSMVPYMQEKLRQAILNALAAVAADVRQGLLETVGLESVWWTDDLETASMVVYLPDNMEAKYAAAAINTENLESWLDEKHRLHIGISPFLATKDIDQTILCVVKVACQFTGIVDVNSNSFFHKH